MYSIQYPSPVPANSLEVVIDVSQAGNTDLTLTCTVTEIISGLTNKPCAHWMGPSGSVTSGHDIVVTETFSNDTTITVTLSFSSLQISHTGLYTCQGTYRCRVEGMSESNSSSLISLIEERVRSGTSIFVTGVLMTVNSEYSSLCEKKCFPTQPPVPSMDSPTINSPAIVGGVVAVVVALTLVIIVFILAVIQMKINHRNVSNRKAEG